MKCIDDLKLKSFYKKNAVETYQVEKLKNSAFVFVTVAFCNAKVIEWQIKLLRKNIEHEFQHLVLDNSPGSEENDISKTCRQEDVAYVRLPRNPFSNSASHGASLNWCCRNILSGMRNQYVGFLDHDCFPIMPVNISGVFLREQEMYGLRQERGDKWYLWPGFSFFRTDAVDISKLNFMPTGWGDTGAGNYEYLYSRTDPDKIVFPTQKYKKILDDPETGYTQEANVECFDDKWIHLMNGSNWMKLDSFRRKEAFIEKMISENALNASIS